MIKKVFLFSIYILLGMEKNGEGNTDMSRIVLAENNKLLTVLKKDFQKKLIFSMYTKK